MIFSFTVNSIQVDYGLKCLGVTISKHECDEKWLYKMFEKCIELIKKKKLVKRLEEYNTGVDNLFEKK